MIVMKKLADGIWVHRRYWIFKDEQGIYVDFGTSKSLNLYKTLEDAKQAINKVMDGTNTRELRIVGTWEDKNG